MRPEPVGRAIRVGGVSIAPGESRVVNVALPGRSPATAREDALPAHITVGQRPGPRLTVLGAPRGFEAVAVAAATAFASEAATLDLEGSVLVVPLLRPGGRFAAGGRPVKSTAAWHYPGDAGGTRREREAFAVFSETCVGSTAIVLLTAPLPGQTALSLARGDLEDPRFRRLALRAALDAVVHVRGAPGTLATAARETGTTVIELVAPGYESTPESTAALLGAIRRLVEAVGLVKPPPPSWVATSAGHRSPTFSRIENIGAECGGLAKIQARPGQGFHRGEALGEITPLSASPAVPILCPRDALVLEAPAARHVGVRRGATLFRLAIGARPVRTRLSRVARREDAPATPPSSEAPEPIFVAAPGEGATSRDVPQEMRVGWVERIALPLLGIARLKAKIDTGARTSALHVSKMRTVGTSAGPHHRPILELTIPHGASGGKRAVVVRAPIREYVQVKDTSGRSERRPVIETTFRLGNVERRIRVTLTDRADMLFPMLIGRTALGPGVIVDPARRYLVREVARPMTSIPAKIAHES
jgi:predicted deacylase